MKPTDWRAIPVSIYSVRSERKLIWIGSARERLCEVPSEARRKAGYELHQVQLGFEPADRKPMPSVGPGVIEIRIHARGEYRVVYTAKFIEGIYVLHVFEKRTRKTRRLDLQIARNALGLAAQQRLR